MDPPAVPGDGDPAVLGNADEVPRTPTPELDGAYNPADPFGLNRYVPDAVPVRTAGRTAGRGTVRPTPATGREDADPAEVTTKIVIPAPKLDIPVDGKFEARVTSDKVRAFVRDVRKYFAVAKGARADETRCLFLTHALSGRAKSWHDEWTLARETYDSDQLLAALLVRFAPQIQSQAVVARNKLASGAYCMRKSETVSAYQSRFEALLTSIPEFSDGDRMFWFQRGLSEALFKRCLTDHLGRSFPSYDALVMHALGKETKDYTQKFSPGAVRFNSLRAQDSPSDNDSDDGAPGPGPTKKRSRPRSVAPVAAAVAPETSSRRFTSTNPAAMTKFGCTYKVLQQRKEDKQCLACGSDDHLVAGCPDWKQPSGKPPGPSKRPGGGGGGAAQQRGNGKKSKTA